MRSSEARRRTGVVVGCALGGWVACSTQFEADKGDDGGASGAGTAGSVRGGAGGGSGEGSGAGGTRPLEAGGASAGKGVSSGGTSGAAANGAAGEGAVGGETADGGTAGRGGSAGTISDYRELVLASQPRAYWRMGITTGVSIPDETGNTNLLVLQGSGHALGLEGAIEGDADRAIGFDGVESFAIASDARTLDFPDGEPFTLECWARRESGGPSYFQQLLSNIEGSPGARNGYLLYLLPEAEEQDNERSSFEYDRVGVEVAVWGPVPAEGVWAHYAVVYDGSNVALYVAGTLTDTASADGATTLRTGPFAVARASNEDAFYFKGAIDEIAVYARPLSVAEIAAHAAFANNP